MLSFFRDKPSVNPEPVPTPTTDNQEPETPKYNGIADKKHWEKFEFVFSSGGRNYFKFRSDTNLSFQRYVAARDIFTEEMWQISPDGLKGWTDSAIKLLQDKRKKDEAKLFEMGVLLARLKEQQELSFSFVRTIKLASVMYFDETENPYDFDYGYMVEKMNWWMKHNDVPGFFLKLPGVNYLPSLTELQQNFPIYLQTEVDLLLRNLTHSISIISSDKESQDLVNTLKSQVAILTSMNRWSKGQFTSSTFITPNG